VPARHVVLTLAIWTICSVLAAQEPAPSPAAPPSPEATTPAAPPREGFPFGPFFVNPRLRIDTIGIDTNVFDTTQDEPQTDFVAIGGPALEVVLPVRETVELHAEAHGLYVYYADTVSQRRFIGGVGADLVWDTGRTALRLGARDELRYERLEEEVDRRLEQRDRAVFATLRRRVRGRLGVRAHVEFAERSLPEPVPTPELLADAYDRQELITRLGLDYSLTYKTRLLAEVERQEAVFDVETDRDSVFRGVRGGIETDRSALVSGHLLGGYRRFRQELLPDEPEQEFTFLSLDATINFTPRTRLGFLLRQDQSWSALSSALSPIVETREYGVHGSKDIYARIVVAGRATRTEYLREGQETDHRDEASAEIVYYWRRFGVGFRVGHVTSAEGAFVRGGSFDATLGGLIVTYR
jgi:hypothetical protein